jgi:hypothetical protein
VSGSLSATAVWSAEGFPPGNESALHHNGFERFGRAAAPARSIRCGGKGTVFQKALRDSLGQQLEHKRDDPFYCPDPAVSISPIH